ncbi:hypothetical protein GCM10027612_00710 [Microbispora bryophytorum subsp. camponoti]
MGDGHVRGLELSRRFYLEAVAPLLARRFGGLTHTAALLGPGSEVLGYDTERSTDHDWGPRLQLFLSPEDAAADGEAVDAMLAGSLPPRFLGYPTNFGPAGGTAPGTWSRWPGRFGTGWCGTGWWWPI